MSSKLYSNTPGINMIIEGYRNYESILLKTTVTGAIIMFLNIDNYFLHISSTLDFIPFSILVNLYSPIKFIKFEICCFFEVDIPL